MGYETDLKLFIDGVWKAGEGRDAHTVLNPVDASPIAEVPYATKADLDEALAATERAWPEWRSTDVEKRGAILHKAAQLLRERADLIARTMTQEQGKPLTEAKLEVLASAQLFDWYAEDAKRDYGRTLVRPAGQRRASSASRSARPRLSRRGISRSICWRRRSARRSPPAAPSSPVRRTRRPELRPNCSARLPTLAFRTALRSSSTATRTSSAKRSSPAA